MALGFPTLWYPQVLDDRAYLQMILAMPDIVVDYPSAALVCAFGIGEPFIRFIKPANSMPFEQDFKFI
jgi:hypothetical protein